MLTIISIIYQTLFGFNILSKKEKTLILYQSSECYEPLTPTEMRVVQTLVSGHTSRTSIASKLNISERTVGTHLTNIYGKILVNNLIDLCLYALRNEWFDCYGRETRK